jgi:hypothetical protein
VLILLLAALPLLWPTIPPLTDLPGHIGRFRILAEAGRGPLAAHYTVHWALIGNLGTDGLVLALAPILGIEPAAKWVVTAIPVLGVAAMLWVAREAQGEVPATAGFALPLAYAAPFQFGFINFCLGTALAVGGLALWLRCARRSPSWVRLVAFMPISCLVWLCHSFGWALLGLFVFGAEWALRRAAGRGWMRAAFESGGMCAPMALPLLALVLGGGDRLAGETGGWFDLSQKVYWLTSLLRERWQLWDLLSVAALFFLLSITGRSRHLSFVPVLGVPAALGGIAFMLLPGFYQGASLVDMRVLPCSVALGLLAIRVAPGQPSVERRIALAAMVFFTARVAGSMVAMLLFAQGQELAARAIAVLPQGSAVLVLVDEPSAGDWRNPRLSHIGDLATARARAFTNAQWALPGQQLVRPRHPAAAPYDRDPSQLVYPPALHGATDFDRAIRDFDRGTFGYVWTIGFPLGRARAPDLVPIWSDGHSAVYRVRHA